MIPAVDVSIGEHLIPQLLDWPARIGQHMVKAGEGCRRSFNCINGNFFPEGFPKAR